MESPCKGCILQERVHFPRCSRSNNDPKAKKEDRGMVMHGGIVPDRNPGVHGVAPDPRIWHSSPALMHCGYRKTKKAGGPSFLGLILVVVFAGGLGCIQSTHASDVFASWNALTVKSVDTEYVDLISSVETRFYNTRQGLQQVLMRQSFALQPKSWLGFNVNYAYFPTRLSWDLPWLEEHRLELEAVPRWKLNPLLTLEFRNRLELRWMDHHSGVNERSRHRVKGIIKVEGLAPVESIFASEEVLLTYSDFELQQNWLIPFGVSLRIHPRAKFSAYYMLQSVHVPQAEWRQGHVFGTDLSLSF
jgi:hypothetical protein